MSTRFLKVMIFILIVLMASGCGPAATSTVVPNAVATRTETYIPHSTTLPLTPTLNWVENFTTFMESDGGFSGAVLLAYNKDVLWESAFGMADLDQGIPNQTSTLFNLGSMNKMFTAIAILQLVEQGRLSLEESISDVLPDYPNADVAELVTIHHLLTHTSGLGDVFTEKYSEDPHRYRTNEDFLSLFVDDPLYAHPGEGFSYSNAGFVVLGQMIEQASGQDYYDYIQQNIFEPSGMERSGSYDIDAIIPDMATGYTSIDIDGNDTGVLVSNWWILPGKGFAAGGGYSTIEDLFRFRSALLGFDLLSPESTEMLLTGKVEMGPKSDYAYGFMDRRVAGQRVVGHTGGFYGICSFLYIFPDNGYTIILLSNIDEGCVPALRYLDEHPFE